jgi:hypothetical protein
MCFGSSLCFLFFCTSLVPNITLCRLTIQIHRITPSYVACMALPYFSSLSHKGMIFRKKGINTKLVFGFSLKIFLRITERDIVINVHPPSWKWLLFFSEFNESWEFSRQTLEKYSHTKFNENPFIGSRVLPCGRTERRLDVMQPIVGFRNVKNASIKIKLAQ